LRVGGVTKKLVLRVSYHTLQVSPKVCHETKECPEPSLMRCIGRTSAKKHAAINTPRLLSNLIIWGGWPSPVIMYARYDTGFQANYSWIVDHDRHVHAT
jgi:hypothetical protein